jgi:hypothetical protein
MQAAAGVADGGDVIDINAEADEIGHELDM